MDNDSSATADELHDNGDDNHAPTTDAYDYDSNEPDADEEPITSRKLLESLQVAWTNEKFAPDLLPHKTDIVDLMLGQIMHMEQNLAQLHRNDFRLIAHRMELARIKYIVSSYLRARLVKIERYTSDILAADDRRLPAERLLSAEERQFADAYAGNVAGHFKHIALRHMPLNLQEPSPAEVVRPNVREHVFLRANVSVSSVVVGRDDEEVDLVAGSRHLMPYNLAAELVLDGRVQLI